MRFAHPIRLWEFMPAALAVLALAPAGSAADEDRGEKIVFTSLNSETKKFTIVSMNGDGSKRTTLSKGDSPEVDPALSPDGKRIAFVAVSKDGQSSAIWVMNADGSGCKQVFRSEGDRFAISPVWSPDSRKIACTVPNDG